ncbi:MAG: UDP-N-acetylglucosamine 1-carboxyvinyltransferase, partial [Synergistaceae bacterium]
MEDKMIIKGGTPLYGTVDVQGAKNAALPIMAASILLKGKKLTLKKVPDLYDINTMSDLLRHIGITVEFKNNFMTIDVPEELSWDAPSELVRKMRASSLVLGPLLARCGKAILPLPGGCVLGSRPIDFHLKGLTKMGAEIDLNRGSVYASAGKLKGERITLDFPSVGATENLMMAAALAHG